MSQVVHIACRADIKELINNPHLLLEKMSLKIFERREQCLKNKINTKVQFYTSNNCIEQGVCQRVDSTHMYVKVNGEVIKVAHKKLILS